MLMDFRAAIWSFSMPYSLTDTRISGFRFALTQRAVVKDEDGKRMMSAVNKIVFPPRAGRYLLGRLKPVRD
jgi:hypothetical protein